MGLFKKKKKKKVYSTDVLAVRVQDDDYMHDTQVRLALNRVENNLSAKDFILSYANTGAAQMMQYLNTGKSSYSDGLPNASISSVGVPAGRIEPILKGIISEPLRVTTTSFGVPEDVTWVKYQLQETLGYSFSGNFLELEGNYYRFSDWEYDDISDRFSATLVTRNDLTVYTQKLTRITITNVDEFVDNKNTYVTREIRYTDTQTQSTFYSVTTVVSETDEEIPIDSEESSAVMEIEGTVVYTNPELTRVISGLLPYLDDTPYYYAEYLLVTQGGTKIWYYNPSTGVYPELPSSGHTSVSLELYPITLFRNGVFSLTEWNISGKQIKSGNVTEWVDRPPTITEKRLKETKTVLNSIGMDTEDIIREIEENPDIDKLQDAFVTFGIAPSDTSPIVSKTLYLLFEYFYKLLPPTDFSGNNAYYYSIEEAPYNASLRWLPTPNVTANEVIGAVGTYTHRTAIDNYTATYRTVVPYQGSRYYERIFYEEDEYGVVTRADGTKWVSIRVYDGIDWSGDPTYRWETRQVVPESKHTATLLLHKTYSSKQLVLKWQINPTQTKTLRIVNPHVNANSTEVLDVNTGAVDATQHLWVNTISRGKRSGTVYMNTDDKDLIIPLPVAVLANLSYIEKTDLFGRSMHLVFYAAQYDVITYYTGTFFSKILKVVAIVIAVIALYFGQAQLSAAVVAAATTSEAVMIVAQHLLIGLSLSVALKLIADKVDSPLLGGILSIAAIATAMHFAGGFDTFEFDLKGAAQLAGMASTAIDVYVGVASEALTAQMKALNLSIEQFSQQYSSLTEQFSTLLQSLNQGLTAGDLVDLTLGVSSATTHPMSSLSPSALRYMMIDGYRDFDTLYRNEIASFVDKQLRLGVSADV